MLAELRPGGVAAEGSAHPIFIGRSRSFAMAPRKCITGRIGDASFQEVLSLIQWGTEEAIFSVHRGDAEKIIHFAPGRALVLELPSPDRGPARDALTGSTLSEALLEAAAWQGALFEYLEGPAPGTFAEAKGVITIDEAARERVAGHTESVARGSVPTLLPGSDSDPLRRIDAFVPLLPTAQAKGLFLRELADCYKAIGCTRRAVLCLRQLAAHQVEWGALLNAIKTLEDAIRICPSDFPAASELVLLAQRVKDPRLAENTAKSVCTELHKHGLGDEAARLCRLLLESPSDPFLKSIVGELRLDRGDVKGGVRELWFAAQAHEESKSLLASERVLRRILAVDPTHAGARKKLRSLRNRRVLVSQLRRWATLLTALVIIGGWYSWDFRSVSASAALRQSGESMEPREAIQLVRDAAFQYPVTLHVERMASLERALVAKSFEDDRQQLSQALAKLEDGRLTEARAILEKVNKSSLFQLIRDRSHSGMDEIQHRRKTVETRIGEASEHLKEHRYDRAFEVYRELLSVGVDPEIVSSLLVPIRVETFPQGGRLRVADREVGATPNWVLMPAERECKLEIFMPGFTRTEILGPVWDSVERKDPVLRVPLLPEKLVEVPTAGGVFASGMMHNLSVVVVLGADGVLRALSAAKPVRWELVLDLNWASYSAPCMVSKTIVLGSTQGRAFGYSALLGNLQWECALGKKGGLVTVGPSLGGQVLATGSEGAMLINAETGRVTRQLDVPLARRFAFQSIAGETAVFLLDGGDWIGVDVRTGRRVFEQRRQFPSVEWITTAGNHVVVGGRDGNVMVMSMDSRVERWRKSFAERSLGAFAIDSKLVVIGTSAGLLFGFHLQTGDVAWQADLRAPITELTVCPTGESRTLVAHTDRRGERVFVCVSTWDGRALWEAPLGPTGASWAAINKGCVGLSTAAGGVLLLRSPGR